MEQRISEYNEAGLKMTRIHEIQRIINLASIDKLGFFYGQDVQNLQVVGKRNYLVIFECLNQLFHEMTKIDDKTRERIKTQRNVLRKFLKDFPPFIKANKADGSYKEMFVNSNWVIIEEQLDSFQELIKLSGDRHGYSGKDTKDPRLAVTN